MCGRFVTVSSPALLAERLQVDEISMEDAAANYNVAPRTEIPMVSVTKDGARVLERVRWGLVPSWAKDTKIGDRLINARGEQLAEKPAFRRAFTKRRSIIPADGFYEWQVVPGRKAKQPVFIARRDREPLLFAGLYEVWKDPAVADAAWLRTCVIVTTDANETLAPVHDRMPVVLAADACDEWLDPEVHDTARLSRLLVPAPSGEFEWYPVSTRVNRPANNGPDLIERVEPDALFA